MFLYSASGQDFFFTRLNYQPNSLCSHIQHLDGKFMFLCFASLREAYYTSFAGRPVGRCPTFVVRVIDICFSTLSPNKKLFYKRLGVRMYRLCFYFEPSECKFMLLSSAPGGKPYHTRSMNRPDNVCTFICLPSGKLMLLYSASRQEKGFGRIGNLNFALGRLVDASI